MIPYIKVMKGTCSHKWPDYLCVKPVRQYNSLNQCEHHWPLEARLARKDIQAIKSL